MDNNKTYRVRTNVGSDTVVHFQATRDIDFLEILSLKMRNSNNYKTMTSDTGVVVGRVIANGGFGIPNAKVSIFINADSDNDDVAISNLYSYSNAFSKDGQQKRYNLLPDSNNTGKECFQVVGTFPSKRLVLDDSVVLEVYEKYYKLTAVTNQSGDFMLYGVPTGAQTLHVDIDLSDIGILSQKPIDMIYQGYDINQFNSGSQFKTGDNLENLVQVITQNQNVDVYPFWGDSSSDNIAITRCDINIAYEFKPTCVFMGSTITDTGKNAISKTCGMKEGMGRNSEVVTNSGTIEMIRKTPDGRVEDFPIMGNKLINGDGVFCYQIPMNLDYMMTDEEGKLVPTDKPGKGIATRACVRFRFSLDEMDGDLQQNHRGKYLVPNNPKLVEKDDNGQFVSYTKLDDGRDIDSYYKFGSDTNDEDFKDLYWNKVYSVKSYIPRLQKSFLPNTTKYTSFKAVNYSNNANPLPYNNLRVDINLQFVVLCIIAKIVLYAVTLINWVSCIFKASDSGDDEDKSMKTCIPFQIDEESTTVYVPGCRPRFRWDDIGSRSSRYVNTMEAFIGDQWLIDNGKKNPTDPAIPDDPYNIKDGDYNRLYIKDDPLEGIDRETGDVVFTSAWGVRICDRAIGKSNGTFNGTGTELDNNLLSWKVVYDDNGELALSDKVDANTWMLDTVAFDAKTVLKFFNDVKEYISKDMVNRNNTYYASCQAVYLGTTIQRYVPYCSEYKLRATPSYRRLFSEFGYSFNDIYNTCLEPFRYVIDLINFDIVYFDTNGEIINGSDNNPIHSLPSGSRECDYKFGIMATIDANVDESAFGFESISKDVAYSRITERNRRLFVWSMRNKGVFRLTKVTDLIESTLAEQQEVIKLNFSNDWVNGLLYFPMWEMRRTRKRSIGKLTWGGKDLFCKCGERSYRLKLYQTCASEYNTSDNTPNYDAEDTDTNGKYADGDPKKNNFVARSLKRYVRLKGGVIKNVKNRDGLNLYYYTNGNPVKKTESLKHGKTDSEFVPLFATDIILLGSLDENDIHGVPQLFDHLSSTSANIPPMTTQYESIEDDIDSDSNNEAEDPDTNESKQYVAMTGMDFSHKGAYANGKYKRTVKYGNGLFANVTCFNAYTISKTCVNARRMCELGVGGDSTYGADGDTDNGRIKYADGFVSQFDITDHEGRSMFATMNYGNLNNKVFDKSTGYYNPQFKFLAPYAFNGPGRQRIGHDGSLQSLIEAGGANKLDYYDIDFSDKHYTLFRNGAPTQRPRFMDYRYDVNHGQMPFYQNSYYFYFGLKDGSTAYDEFMGTYFSSCPKVGMDTIDFSVDVAYLYGSNAGMYCYSGGKVHLNRADISINLKNVSEPYSVKITRQSDNTTVFEADQSTFGAMTLRFIGTFSGNTESFNVYNPVDDSESYAITDDKYVVTITDANGDSSKRISVVSRYEQSSEDKPIEDSGNTVNNVNSTTTSNGIRYNVTVSGLKGQYLPSLNGNSSVLEQSWKDELYNNGNYGYISIESMTIGGDDHYFTSVLRGSSTQNKYELKTRDGYIVYLYIESVDGDTTFNAEDYFIPDEQGGSILRLENGYPSILVARPCTVGLKFELVVEDDENPSCVGYYQIANGGSVEAYINDAPAEFVMSTEYKNEDAYTENGRLGKFYNPLRAANTIEGVSPFFHTDEENMYSFYDTSSANSRYYWSKFMSNGDSTVPTGNGYLTNKELLDIAKAKLTYMLNMSASSNIPCRDYISMDISADSDDIEFSTKTYKGVIPAPLKNDDSQGMFTQEVSDKKSYSNNDVPHIVGNNYCKLNKHTVGGITYYIPSAYNSENVGPFFNPAYTSGSTSEIGSYMAMKASYSTPYIDSVVIGAPKKADTTNDVEKNGDVNLDYLYSQQKSDNGNISTNASYKHISIDRRLDYDLDIVLPVRDVDGNADEGIMHGGYIAGCIINGIEMDYDEGYNIVGKCVNNASGDVIAPAEKVTIRFNTKFIDDYVANYSAPYEYVIFKNGDNVFTSLLKGDNTVEKVAKQPGVTIIGTTGSVYAAMKNNLIVYTSQTQVETKLEVGSYMYYDGPNTAKGQFKRGSFYTGTKDSCGNLHWIEIDKSDIYIYINEDIVCTVNGVTSEESGVNYEYTLNVDNVAKTATWISNWNTLSKRLYKLSLTSNDGTVYDMRRNLVKDGYTPSISGDELSHNEAVASLFTTESGYTPNGYLDRSGDTLNNYPTKRILGSVKLPISEKYTVGMASCSYEPNVIVDDANSVTCKVHACDETKIVIPNTGYFDYNTNPNSRFIVETESYEGGLYTPDNIRELIYSNHANTDEANWHSIHQKLPVLVQSDKDGIETQADSFNQWIVGASRVSTTLGMMYNSYGMYKKETMALNAQEDGRYNLDGYTACDEKKTYGDVFGNIVENSLVGSPTFSRINLNVDENPYIFIADERMYVNNTENRLLQRVKVTKISDIYRLDRFNVSNLYSVDGELSFILTTNNSDKRNVLLDIVDVMVYNRLTRQYIPSAGGNAAISESTSEGNKVYTIMLSYQPAGGTTTLEAHIKTKSGITYAMSI